LHFVSGLVVDIHRLPRLEIMAKGRMSVILLAMSLMSVAMSLMSAPEQNFYQLSLKATPPVPLRAAAPPDAPEKLF